MSEIKTSPDWLHYGDHQVVPDWGVYLEPVEWTISG